MSHGKNLVEKRLDPSNFVSLRVFSFFVLFHQRAFGFIVWDLLGWRGLRLGASLQDIKVKRTSCVLGGRSGGACPVGMSAKSSPLQGGTDVGAVAGVGGSLGSSCSERKQTLTPNQTHIEIPGETGGPKLLQARLGQGGVKGWNQGSRLQRGMWRPGLH